MKKHILKYCVLAALVAAGLWYAWTHQKLLLSLKSIPFWYLIVIFCLTLTRNVLKGLQLRSISTVFGLRLSFREWFGLSVCNTMYNYFVLARAGAGVRALYLKKKHSLSYAHFGSLFAGSNALKLMAAALTGLFTCILAQTLYGERWVALTVAFLLLLSSLLGATVILAVSLKAVRYVPTKTLRRILSDVSDGLKLFPKHRDSMLKFAALSFVQICAAAAGFFVCCSALGMTLNALQVLAIQSMACFAVLLPLTPGGLGIREGIIASSGHLLGLPPEMAMLAALVQRGVAMIVTFGLGLVFSYLLLEGLKVPYPASSSETSNQS